LRSPLRQRRAQVATAVGVFVGGLAFVLALFDYRFDPTRTAVRLGYASNFFDLQAQAFLRGNIDVPNGSLGIEGFVVDAKTYMYFPPLPALLRVPIMLVTHDFDGHLSLVSMGVAWVVFTVMTVATVWLVRRCLRGDTPVTMVESVGVALFIAAATGGTVLTFDGALPWVYHEVYVWAVALVVGAIYWLVRTTLEPTRRNASWLGFFSVAAALTRTTGGWAVALVAIGVGLWLRSGRADRGLPTDDEQDGLALKQRRDGWHRLVLAGSVALGLSVAYNAYKFGHPYLFPLDKQVWTSVNEHRRLALEANGGTITGLQFFETAFVNYFRPDGIRLLDHYPYITLPAEPARAYGGAYLDQYYRTGSVTAFMPLLLALSLVSLPMLLRRTDSLGQRALRPAVAAGAIVTGGVMAYGYIAHRYTSEFVPGLVVAGSVGLWGFCGWVERRREAVQVSLLTLATSLALFSILAQLLTAHAAVATTWRGEPLLDYLRTQRAMSGGPGSPQARLVTRSDSLPAQGFTDELHIVGDCESLYLNAGDAYEPWVLVARRPDVIVVEISENVRAARSLLFTVHGTHDRKAYLETDGKQYARLVLENETGEWTGPWFPVYDEGRFRIGVGVDTDLGHVVVTSTPGGVAGYIPFIEWDKDWNASPGSIEFPFDQRRVDTWQGVTLTRQYGLPVQLCRQLLADAQ
jgi:hypothetical protein